MHTGISASYHSLVERPSSAATAAPNAVKVRETNSAAAVCCSACFGGRLPSVSYASMLLTFLTRHRFTRVVVGGGRSFGPTLRITKIGNVQSGRLDERDHLRVRRPQRDCVSSGRHTSASAPTVCLIHSPRPWGAPDP